MKKPYLNLIWGKNRAPQITPHATCKVDDSYAGPTSHLFDVSQDREIEYHCDDNVDNSEDEKNMKETGDILEEMSENYSCIT